MRKRVEQLTHEDIMAGKRKRKSSHENKLRLCCFDIEVAPRIAYVWRTGEQYVNANQLITDNFILSISWEWINTGESGCVRLTSKEAKAGDDIRILKKFSEVASTADYFIGHNLDGFDIKEFNTRLIKNRLPSLPLYRTYDTWKLSKRYFRFASNKMDAICKNLGIGKKIDTDFQLWVDCCNGKEKALAKMAKYNQHDVAINVKLFQRLLPYIKLTSKMMMPIVDNKLIESAMAKHECIACGTIGKHEIKSKYTTIAGMLRYHLTCKKCGANQTLPKGFRQ